MRTARPGSTISLAMAALATGPALLGAPHPLAAQGPPDSVVRSPATVTGEVVDVESGDPIPGALVTLAALADTGVVPPVQADSAGGFLFPPVESGRYLLHIARIGYRTLTDTILLARDGETRVQASMVPDAVDLEAVVVTAVRRTPPFMRDFQRRRARGIGSFITREDIEEQRPFVTSDLFRMLPGVRVVPRGATGGAALQMRGGCRPQLYIDGVAAGPEMSVDLSLQPHDIEAVEVYSTAGAPVQYARSACGVILVWTRVPQPVANGRSFWKRLAIVSGLALGLLLMNR